MFEIIQVPVKTQMVGLYAGTLEADLAPLAPARLVPVLRMPEGVVVGDTLAIAETLAERHPEAGLWPEDPAARALARWIVAEMHSGFHALREACPMMLHHAWVGFQAGAAVRADLMRIEELWSIARQRHGTPARPWLFGEYCLADVFFAPVATRIATYGLRVGDEASTYVTAHLADPAFRRWRAMGEAKARTPPPYAQDLAKADWPGPEIRGAHARDHGPSENDLCPYSGDPVTHFLETGGRVFGFCNEFCRDKTLADPDAWPAFAQLLRGSVNQS